MIDPTDRRGLLLAALAAGGGAAVLDALAPAFATSAYGLGSSGAPGRPGVSPEAHGADGSVTGDSAGLRAALAGDAFAVDLAPRTYRLDAAGLAQITLSGKELRGVRGRTTIKMAEPPGRDMMLVMGARDFAIRDIVFDGAGLLARRGAGSYPGFRPCLLIERCERFAVTGCSFVGFDTCGLLANVVTEGLVADNRADRGRSAPTPNYGLCVVGGGRSMTLRDNNAVASNIAVDISDSTISGNDVSGWGFSAGINIAEDQRNARNLVVAFNRCHDSAGVPDRDGFYLDGIECWAPGSIILGNQCRGSIGNGISFGANDVIVAANQCHDNGSLIGGRAVGWGIRALADSEDASRSLVVANRCGDGRPSGGKRQGFGYGENSTRLAGVELWANDFEGNAHGPFDVHSPATRIDGVRAGSFVPRGLGIDFLKATGTFTDVRGSIRVTVDVTLPRTRDGAAFGFDGLPAPASGWGILLPAVSPVSSLRLAVAPTSHRAVAEKITNADLSGARVVLCGEYPSMGS